MYNNFKSTIMDVKELGDFFSKVSYLRLPRFIIKNLILPAGGEGNLYRVYAYLVFFAKFAEERDMLDGLSFAHKAGELVASREEIAAFTGLSRSMVSNCVAELVKKGWVETYFIGKLSYFLVCNYAELTSGAPVSDKQRKGARGRAPQQQVMPVYHDREERRTEND